MDALEFRQQLARLGFSQHGLARWLGHTDKNARKVRRWASGAVPIPDDLAAELRALTPDQKDRAA